MDSQMPESGYEFMEPAMKPLRCPSCGKEAPLPTQPGDTHFECFYCAKKFKLGTRKNASATKPPVSPRPPER